MRHVRRSGLAGTSCLARWFASQAGAGCAISCGLLLGCGAGGASDSGDDGAEPSGRVTSPDDELIEDADESSEAVECARDSYDGERADVNLYLLLDVSGSMLLPIRVDGGGSQWDAVRGALTGFIESPESEGFNLAMNYYPLLSERADCSDGSRCDANVACVTSVCDLTLQHYGLVVPCQFDSDCGAAFEIDGELVFETCRDPGQCSNGNLEICMEDPQCGGLGTCEFGRSAGVCPGVASCDPYAYFEPSIQRSKLPEGADEMIESLLDREPDPFGTTPTHIALAGAYLQLDEWRMSEPNTKSFVILATDGLPVGCSQGATAVQAEAAAMQTTYAVIEAAASLNIDTFVIGVLPDLTGAGEEASAVLGPLVRELSDRLSTMAEIGNTGASFNVALNDTTTESFLEALSAIRGEVLPCEYVIPDPDTGAVVFNRLNVEVGAESEFETVPKVAGASDCVAGELAWHYNVDEATQTPTRVVLCPATCDTVNQAGSTQVDIVLGCGTVVRVR
jgi:hypothetical protein